MRSHIKKITLTWALILSFIISESVCVSAAIPENAIIGNEEVVYFSEQIVNEKQLIARAKNGVNDLEKYTDVSISVNTDKSDDIETESYLTSQLLKRIKNSEEEIETYAVSVVTNSSESYNGSDSKLGVTLTSTLYLESRYNNNIRQIRLLRTQATVIGGSPARLVMVNGARKDVNYTLYTNSRLVNNPAGTYTLQPSSQASTLWIEMVGGILSQTDTVFFADGNSFRMNFTVSPKAGQTFWQ